MVDGLRPGRLSFLGQLSSTDYFLLAGPATWSAFKVAARNPVGIPHIERLVALAIFVWILGVALSMVVSRLTKQSKPSVYAAFFVMTVLVSGGALQREWGAVAVGVVALLLGGLSYWLTAQAEVSWLISALVVALSAFLLSAPLLDLARAGMLRGTSKMASPPVADINIDDPRDVYLIVLDGFPSLSDRAATDLRDDLQNRLFETPAEARTSYPMTDYSIPSILLMDYPIEAGPVNDATLQDLYSVIGGANPVRAGLGANGYTTIMVESGWSGSACVDYDICVASSWLDDPSYHVIRDSVLGGVLAPVTGYHYATNSLAVMEWMRAELPQLSNNGSSDFVFAHVLAPHPPLLLDSDCSIVEDDRRAGFFFSRPGVPDSEREEYLVDQVECVAQFMLDVSDAIDEDTILVFASDHGTDRADQLLRDPSTWTEDEVNERMGVLVAARGLGDDCSLGSPIHLPNLMRRVISCVAEVPLSDIEHREILTPREWPETSG